MRKERQNLYELWKIMCSDSQNVCCIHYFCTKDIITGKARKKQQWIHKNIAAEYMDNVCTGKKRKSRI